MTIVPMAKNSALARTKLINNLVLSADGTDSSTFCCVGCCAGCCISSVDAPSCDELELLF